jgi:hypothetical protein
MSLYLCLSVRGGASLLPKGQFSLSTSTSRWPYLGGKPIRSCNPAASACVEALRAFGDRTKAGALGTNRALRPAQPSRDTYNECQTDDAPKGVCAHPTQHHAAGPTAAPCRPPPQSNWPPPGDFAALYPPTRKPYRKLPHFRQLGTLRIAKPSSGQPAGGSPPES